MLNNPPLGMLAHTVQIEKLAGLNDFGGKTYESPITLIGVRFDREYSQTGATNDRSDDKAGTVFVYPFNQIDGLSFDDSWNGSRVSDEAGKTYTIRKISPYYQDTSGDIYSWEFEVI